VYYVSPTGDDSNDGLTPGTAWGTLHTSVGRLANGDRLYVLPGTYDVVNEPDANLTVSQSNVTIEGYTPGTAILEGSGAMLWDVGIEVAADSVSLVGLNVTSFSIGGIDIFDDSDGCQIRLNDIYDNGTAGTGFGLRHEGVTGGWILEVDDNSIHNDGFPRLASRGIDFSNSAGGTVTIENNEIYGFDDPGSAGIELENLNSDITGNVIQDNDIGIRAIDPNSNIGLNQMYGNVRHIEIAGSHLGAVSICNNELTPGPIGSHLTVTGILVAEGFPTTDFFIAHNTISGGDSAAVSIESDTADCDIRYNLITDYHTGTGIKVSGGSTSTLRYNNIYDCGTLYDGVAPGVGDQSLPPGYVGGGDYHLAPNSQCRDMIPGTEPDPIDEDLDGNPRPTGEPKDPGCYEYQRKVPAMSSLTTLLLAGAAVLTILALSRVRTRRGDTGI
jgi:hypothetical protein